MQIHGASTESWHSASNNSASDNPDATFTITDIRPSQHDQNRVNVYVCNQYDFSLDISQVIDLGVKVGKSYTAQEISEFREASQFGKLYVSTLEWLIARPRSIAETRRHLSQRKIKRTIDNRHREEVKQYKLEHKDENPYRIAFNRTENGRLKLKNSIWNESTKPLPEISDSQIEKVIAKLISKGYLDDTRFAKFYIENRNIKKGISESKLRQELSEKGVDRKIVDTLMSASPRDSRSEIMKIITKKRRRYADKKLITYLTNQGFPYSLAKECVELASSDSVDQEF